MAKAPVVKTEDEAAAEPKATCGIIMPIAAMLPKYEASHWVDVRRVIDAAIDQAGMVPQIVSDSFEGDVIQRRIISNLYENPVVVCDVSGLNPNVMFELGMRLTFKMPVVIITDDYATIPFDTKVIEHLGYPRDLHIHQTTEFINKLSAKIMQLHEAKKENRFRSFIEEFGSFEVLEPTKNVVEADQFILHRLDRIENALSNMNKIRARDVQSPAAKMANSDTLQVVLHQPVTSEEYTAIIEVAKMIWDTGQDEYVTIGEGREVIRIPILDANDMRRQLIEQFKTRLSGTVLPKIAMVAWSSQIGERISDWPKKRATF